MELVLRVDRRSATACKGKVLSAEIAKGGIESTAGRRRFEIRISRNGRRALQPASNNRHSRAQSLIEARNGRVSDETSTLIARADVAQSDIPANLDRSEQGIRTTELDHCVGGLRLLVDVGDLIRREAAVRQLHGGCSELSVPLTDRNEGTNTSQLLAEQVGLVIVEEVEGYERELAEMAAEERRAEIVHLIEAGRIALECFPGGGAGATRGAVDVPIGMRCAAIGPGIGDVLPVVGAPLD